MDQCCRVDGGLSRRTRVRNIRFLNQSLRRQNIVTIFFFPDVQEACCRIFDQSGKEDPTIVPDLQ